MCNASQVTPQRGTSTLPLRNAPPHPTPQTTNNKRKTHRAPPPPANKKPRHDDTTPQLTHNKIKFGHVVIRCHARELWGGGGVPADDGPPLGLGWDVASESTQSVDAYESLRRHTRSPKDAYCVFGFLDATRRLSMLLQTGTSLAQVRTAKQHVARLNRERLHSSSVVYDGAWLFSAPRLLDPTDVPAVLGVECERLLCFDAADWADGTDVAESFVEAAGTVMSQPGDAPVEGDGLGDGDAWSATIKVVLTQLLGTAPTVVVVHCPVDAVEAASPRRWLVEGLVRVAAEAACEPEGALGSTTGHGLSVVLQEWPHESIGAHSIYNLD